MSHSEDLAAIKAAMKGCDWRIEAVLTFTGTGVQVWARDKQRSGGRYKKVGPLLVTRDGDNTVADTLAMLGAMAVDQ